MIFNIKRLTDKAGQDFDSPKCRVRSPHITARESIEIGNYIVELQKANVELQKANAELQKDPIILTPLDDTQLVYLKADELARVKLESKIEALTQFSEDYLDFHHTKKANYLIICFEDELGKLKE
jgi:hypothetical protein